MSRKLRPAILSDAEWRHYMGMVRYAGTRPPSRQRAAKRLQYDRSQRTKLLKEAIEVIQRIERARVLCRNSLSVRAACDFLRTVPANLRNTTP